MSTVIIHGATNTSNFGDVLFASLFYDELKQNNDVLFLEMPKYGIGDFTRKEIGYTKHLTFRQIFKSDALVYMSGGYFGESKKTFSRAIQNWIRYSLIGEIMHLFRKKIYVCGVGGGPLSQRFLRKSVVKILDHAEYVSMRDLQSAEYFKNAGVTRSIDVTADTALTITPAVVPPLIPEIENALTEYAHGRKMIFIHLHDNSEFDELFSQKVVPGLCEFLDKNPDYCLVAGTDGINASPSSKTLDSLNNYNVFYYDYTSAWQLCALLLKVDAIVTMKLHVGIIGASLGKSVISFPIHPHKTQRFYKQIEEEDRCVQLSCATPDLVLSQLESFIYKPICIGDDLRQLSRQNLEILHSIGGEINAEKESHT